MHNVREFHYPGTVAQALELLHRLEGTGLVVAGGSVVSGSRDPAVVALVDITRLGLGFVRQLGGTLRVGATATIEELASHPLIERFAGGLIGAAAATVRLHPRRNQITLGGHIVAQTAVTELSPALLALDAVVSIARSGRKEQKVPYEQFASDAAFRVLGHRELVTELSLDRRFARARSAYVSCARSSADPAWAQVAVALICERGTVGEARIAIGGITEHAVRAQAAERRLEKTAVSESLFDECAVEAVESIRPVDGRRLSGEYRRELTRVLVRRALGMAWAQGRRTTE